MSKKFSELDRAVSLNNGDLLALAQVDAEAETGYKSAAAPVSDVAQKILKGISFPADLETDSKNVLGAINEAAMDKNIANPYSNQATYDVGDFVIYQTVLYKCTTAVSVAEDFDDTKWEATLVSNIDVDSEKAIEAYDTLNKFPSDVLWNDNALFGKLKRTFNGITTDFDVSSLMPTQGKTYYVKPNGNDSNSGEDRDHPLQKLSTAIAKADVQTIIVMDGIYNIGRVGGSFTKGINIIADTNAHPIFIMSRDKTWSKTNGYNYIYETTDSASTFYGVIKADTRDSYGDLLSYSLAASLADVEANENSYFVSGNTIYVHSASSPQKLYVLVSGVNLHATLSNGDTLYVEGIEFIGGNYGGLRVTNGSSSKKPLVLVKNCGFSRSYMGNDFYLQGCSGIVQNCYASHAADDGFNYHATLNVIPDSIEIGCIGRFNGTVGNNTNNGSTTHDAAKILRLNCEFFGNIGPNIADVDNSKSFNYGVVSLDSAGSSTNKTGIQCQNSIMYCDTCSAYNNGYNFQAYLGGVMYVKNCCGSLDIGSDGKALAY